MGVMVKFDHAPTHPSEDGTWITVTGEWFDGRFSIEVLNGEFFFDLLNDCCGTPMRQRAKEVKQEKCEQCKKLETFSGKKLLFYPLAYGQMSSFATEAHDFIFNMLTNVGELNPYNATVELSIIVSEIEEHLEGLVTV